MQPRGASEAGFASVFVALALLVLVLLVLGATGRVMPQTYAATGLCQIRSLLPLLGGGQACGERRARRLAALEPQAAPSTAFGQYIARAMEGARARRGGELGQPIRVADGSGGWSTIVIPAPSVSVEATGPLTNARGADPLELRFPLDWRLPDGVTLQLTPGFDIGPLRTDGISELSLKAMLRGLPLPDSWTLSPSLELEYPTATGVPNWVGRLDLARRFGDVSTTFSWTQNQLKGPRVNFTATNAGTTPEPTTPWRVEVQCGTCVTPEVTSNSYWDSGTFETTLRWPDLGGSLHLGFEVYRPALAEWGAFGRATGVTDVEGFGRVGLGLSLSYGNHLAGIGPVTGLQSDAVTPGLVLHMRPEGSPFAVEAWYHWVDRGENVFGLGFRAPF
jgi:hypothetical protein